MLLFILCTKIKSNFLIKCYFSFEKLLGNCGYTRKLKSAPFSPDFPGHPP